MLTFASGTFCFNGVLQHRPLAFAFIADLFASYVFHVFYICFNPYDFPLRLTTKYLFQFLGCGFADFPHNISVTGQGHSTGCATYYSRKPVGHRTSNPVHHDKSLSGLLCCHKLPYNMKHPHPSEIRQCFI